MKNAWLFLKKIFVNIRKAIRNARISSARNNWRVSRNGNMYNPACEATVYDWENGWNIARYNVHHQGFSSKKAAMDEAFKMWLKDRYGHCDEYEKI